MDAGDVLLQLAEPIAPTDTYATLTDRLAQLGSKAVLHTINNLDTLRRSAQRQSNEASTKAPKLPTEWAALDFTQPARRVYDHWRATHGCANAHTHWKGERINMVEMDGYDRPDEQQQQQQQQQQQRLEAGDVRYDRQRKLLRVRCGCGGSVLVSRVHLAAKDNAVSAKVFAEGYLRTEEARDSARFEYEKIQPDVAEGNKAVSIGVAATAPQFASEVS